MIRSIMVKELVTGSRLTAMSVFGIERKYSSTTQSRPTMDVRYTEYNGREILRVQWT